MNDLLSVLDVMESSDFGSQRSIRDDIAGMDASLKRAMDRGLTPDEMKTAQDARAAVQAASAILEKLFA